MKSYSFMRREFIALAVGTMVIVSSAAHADGFDFQPPEQQVAQSVLTRAEVLADLQIYQESGLAQLERIGDQIGLETAEVRVARQRYLQLKQSERYTMLVEQYARHNGS